MAGSSAAGVLIEALSMYPNIGGNPEGRFGPLWVAMVLGFGRASAVIAFVRRETAENPLA